MKIHCPECGRLVGVVGGMVVCPDCGYEADLPPEVFMERMGTPRLFQDMPHT